MLGDCLCEEASRGVDVFNDESSDDDVDDDDESNVYATASGSFLIDRRRC